MYQLRETIGGFESISLLEFFPGQLLQGVVPVLRPVPTAIHVVQDLRN